MEPVRFSRFVLMTRSRRTYLHCARTGASVHAWLDDRETVRHVDERDCWLVLRHLTRFGSLLGSGERREAERYRIQLMLRSEQPHKQTKALYTLSRGEASH